MSKRNPWGSGQARYHLERKLVREGRSRIGAVTSCADLARKAAALPRRMRRAVLVDAGLL